MDSGRVKSAAIFHNVRVVERNVYGLANKTKKMTHSLEYLLEFKSVKKKIFAFIDCIDWSDWCVRKKNTLIPIAHFNQLIIQCISLCLWLPYSIEN